MYSWDLVVHKVESELFPGGLLFLYARDDEFAIKVRGFVGS